MGKLKPVTPGELLLRNFLNPWVLASIAWQKKSVFLPSVLETLWRESAGSLLILICGFAASSVCPTAIGYVRRLPMTQRSLSA